MWSFLFRWYTKHHIADLQRPLLSCQGSSGEVWMRISWVGCRPARNVTQVGKKQTRKDCLASLLQPSKLEFKNEMKNRGLMNGWCYYHTKHGTEVGRYKKVDHLGNACKLKLDINRQGSELFFLWNDPNKIKEKIQPNFWVEVLEDWFIEMEFLFKSENLYDREIWPHCWSLEQRKQKLNMINHLVSPCRWDKIWNK